MTAPTLSAPVMMVPDERTRRPVLEPGTVKTPTTTRALGRIVTLDTREADPHGFYAAELGKPQVYEVQAVREVMGRTAYVTTTAYRTTQWPGYDQIEYVTILDGLVDFYEPYEQPRCVPICFRNPWG